MFYVKIAYDWRTVWRLFQYKLSAQFHSSTDVCSKLYKDLPCGTRHRLETRQKGEDNFLFRILWTMLSNKEELVPSPLLPRTERIPLYFHYNFLMDPNYFDSHLRVSYKREPNLWLGDKQLGGTPVSGSQWRGGTKRERARERRIKALARKTARRGPDIVIIIRFMPRYEQLIRIEVVFTFYLLCHLNPTPRRSASLFLIFQKRDFILSSSANSNSIMLEFVD